MDSCPAWHEVQDRAVQSLARLHKGARGIVSGVTDGLTSLGEGNDATLARRLIELGFVAGERIEVVGEVRPGGDPIAVRIGSTIFALRRREAASVLVQLEQE